MAELPDNDAALAEAGRVLLHNREQLTPAMKELIVDHFARQLEGQLTEARRHWAAGEPLNAKEKSVLLGWLHPLVNHAKSTNKRLVSVKEAKEAKETKETKPVVKMDISELEDSEVEFRTGKSLKRGASPGSEPVSRAETRRRRFGFSEDSL